METSQEPLTKARVRDVLTGALAHMRPSTPRRVRRELRRALKDATPLPRGGHRAGAGRKSLFPKDKAVAFPLVFTQAGLDLMASIQKRTGLSRNEILEVLVVAHGPALHFDRPGVEYPGKASDTRMCILLSPPAAQALRQVRQRIAAAPAGDKSWSELGEALLRRFWRDTKFPVKRPTKR